MTERLMLWIAWHLPRRLAYWTFIRVAARGTTGEYGSTDVTTLTVIDAMQRWSQ